MSTDTLIWNVFVHSLPKGGIKRLCLTPWDVFLAWFSVDQTLAILWKDKEDFWCYQSPCQCTYLPVDKKILEQARSATRPAHRHLSQQDLVFNTCKV